MPKQHLPILKICSCPCQAGPNSPQDFFRRCRFVQQVPQGFFRLHGLSLHLLRRAPQQLLRVVGTVSLPLESLFRVQGESDGLSLRRQTAFVRDNNAQLRVLFGAPYQQDASGCRLKIHRPHPSVTRFLPLHLVQMPDEDNSTPHLLRYRSQALENGAHLIGPVHIHICS